MRKITVSISIVANSFTLILTGAGLTSNATVPQKLFMGFLAISALTTLAAFILNQRVIDKMSSTLLDHNAKITANHGLMVTHKRDIGPNANPLPIPNSKRPVQGTDDEEFAV